MLSQKKPLLLLYLLYVDVRVNGKTLVLHRVTRSQMGEYFCIASNQASPTISKRVDLKVNCEYHKYLLLRFVILVRSLSVRPGISVANPSIHAREGRDVTLECVIEAYPRGINFWEKENGALRITCYKEIDVVVVRMGDIIDRLYE